MALPLLATGLLARFAFMAISWALFMVPVFVVKLITAMGIGVVTYRGLDLLFNALKSQMATQFMSLNNYGNIGNWLNMLQIGSCINIFLTAFAIRIALSSVNGVINRVTGSNSNL